MLRHRPSQRVVRPLQRPRVQGPWDGVGRGRDALQGTVYLGGGGLFGGWGVLLAYEKGQRHITTKQDGVGGA